MVVKFISYANYSFNGVFGMAFIEDSDTGNVTSMNDILMCEHSVVRHQAGYPTLRYRPKREPLKWFFTNDQSLTSDHFEMPGKLYYGTQQYGSAITPGFLEVDYVVEFCSLVPPNVQAKLLLSVKQKINPTSVGVDNVPIEAPTEETWSKLTEQQKLAVAQFLFKSSK